MVSSCQWDPTGWITPGIWRDFRSWVWWSTMNCDIRCVCRSLHLMALNTWHVHSPSQCLWWSMGLCISVGPPTISSAPADDQPWSYWTVIELTWGPNGPVLFLCVTVNLKYNKRVAWVGAVWGLAFSLPFTPSITLFWSSVLDVNLYPYSR